MYTCACERTSNLSITNTILSLASVPFFTSFSPSHPHKWANVARYTGTIIVSMFICMPLNMYFKLILDKNSYPFHFWISCTENSTIQYDSHGERRYCPVPCRIKIQRRKIRDKCREKARQREKTDSFWQLYTMRPLHCKHVIIAKWIVQVVDLLFFSSETLR